MQQTKQTSVFLNLAVLLAVFLAAPAIADSPSYNFVEAGYSWLNLDDGIDGDGYGLEGSFEIGDNMFAFAGYASFDADYDIDGTFWEAGLGYHTGISDNTDFFAKAYYLDQSIDLGVFGGTQDDDGYGVGIGIRGNVTDLIELFGEINYEDIGDDAITEFGAGIRFNLSDSFALGLNASFDEDVTTYGASARLYFGK